MGFHWNWSHRKPLPNMHPNFRLLQEKWMFSSDHTVQCKHSEALLLFKGFYISVGKLFTIQIPRLQPKPTLQADLSKDSSLRLTEGTFLQRVQETSMCSLLVGWDLWCLSSCDALSSREGICGIRNEERIWDIGLVGLHPRDKSHQRSHNRNLGEDFQRARINIQAKTSNIP